MKKLDETGNLADTDPSLYTGFEVDPKTGKAVEKEKEGDDMSDPERHADGGVPDGNKKPNINVQAEAYKPGFVISLVEEPVDERHQTNAYKASLEREPGSRSWMTKPEIKKAAHKGLYDPNKGELTPKGHVAVKASIIRDRANKNKYGPAEYALSTLKEFQQIVQEDKTIKMVWEDTTTGQQGYVTPALFVKVYSKLLLAEQGKEAREQSGSEQKPMSESKPNRALANELLNVGLVNNVKKTSEVLKEDNPVRKAMEIYYNSPNSVDKEKTEYVPSVIKDGKAVLEKKAAPVVSPEKEPVVETKKKRNIYW